MEEKEEEIKYRCVKRDNLRKDAPGGPFSSGRSFLYVCLFVRSFYLDPVMCYLMLGLCVCVSVSVWRGRSVLLLELLLLVLLLMLQPYNSLQTPGSVPLSFHDAHNFNQIHTDRSLHPPPRSITHPHPFR